MNKYVKTGIKALITGGMMIASSEFAVYHLPYCEEKSSLKRSLCSLAGAALGFAIGKEVADDVIWSLSDAIDAAKGDR